MTTTLAPDTGTDRDAIARGLIEVDVLDHEAALWRELADFLAEPLALHNLLSRARREILQGIFDQPEPAPEPEPVLKVVPEPPADVAPEPESVLADVAPRRGGKRRRWGRPTRWQRAITHLRQAWADETGDRDEVRL